MIPIHKMFEQSAVHPEIGSNIGWIYLWCCQCQMLIVKCARASFTGRPECSVHSIWFFLLLHLCCDPNFVSRKFSVEKNLRSNKENLSVQKNLGPKKCEPKKIMGQKKNFSS